jgi:tetratricopeptide (TPR) repeat protein
MTEPRPLSSRSRPRANPFIAGPSVGFTAAFVGREDILHRVELELASGSKSLVLYGQRRIGKTSVLEALTRRLPTRGPYHTVYFDLQDKAQEPLGNVLHLLAEAIAERLGVPPPPFFADTRRHFRETWLPEVLACFEPDARLIILFDEFDVLADPQHQDHAAAKALFPYLRELLGSKLPIFIIFTIGRSIGDLSSDAHALFKEISEHRISVLNHTEANSLLDLSESDGLLRWSHEARAAILEHTHGHPYFLQQIGKELWINRIAERTSPSAPYEVEAADVDAVLPDVLAHSHNVLEWLWGGLTPACRLVASAFAEHGPSVRSTDELQQLLHRSGIRSVIRELETAPHLLLEWDIIEPVGDGFRFRVELLRAWIRLNKPLRMVQDELDRLQPTAENFFSIAKSRISEKNHAEALKFLQDALRENPYHLGAALTLIEIYTSEGLLEDAQRHLESLHDIRPAVAAPKLANLLIIRARGTDDALVAESLYERALTYIPHHSEAKRGLTQLYLTRAQNFERAGRLDDALAAYQRSGATADAKRIEREIAYRRRAAEFAKLLDLEAEHKYADALRLARGLEAEDPSSLPERRGQSVSWEAYIKELAEAQDLVTLIQRAHEHILAGQGDAAATLLIEVLRLRPTYPNAARYLYWAIHGVDPEQRDPAELRRLRAYPYLSGFTVFSAITAVLAILTLMTHGPFAPSAAEREIAGGAPMTNLDPPTSSLPALPPATLPSAQDPADTLEKTPAWTPTAEHLDELDKALRAAFAESSTALLGRHLGADASAEERAWHTAASARINARRHAWLDLAIEIAPNDRKAGLRGRKNEFPPNEPRADDPIQSALAELTALKGPIDLLWLDDPSAHPNGDPCLLPAARALRELRAGDRLIAHPLIDEAAEACGSNPIVDVLRALARPQRPSATAERAIKSATSAILRECEAEANPGTTLEIVFEQPSGSTHLEPRIDGIYKNTLLGDCALKVARARLGRAPLAPAADDVPAIVKSIRF